jgi:hypothetical protein
MSKAVPPAPPGWNKTIADLLAEAKRGERGSVGSPEVDWARDFERNRIPFGFRFPRKGDVYEAMKDIDVQYLTAWAAPYTGGGQGILNAGDRVLVDEDPVYPEPISIYAKAVDYAVVENRMVPASVRADTKYSGFYLSLKTVDLNNSFRLIHEDNARNLEM